MSNHIHLIASANQGFNLSDIMRDFKKFTSKNIYKSIEQNDLESRRNYLLSLFKFAGETAAANTNIKFWKDHFHPVSLDHADV